MVSTRSRGTQQATIDDFTDKDANLTDRPRKKRSTPPKTDADDARRNTPKKVKRESKSPESQSSPNHSRAIKSEPDADTAERGTITTTTTTDTKDVRHKRDVKEENSDIGGVKDKGDQGKEEEEEEEEQVRVVSLKKSDDTETHSEPIRINRAPVLSLFASCAAQFRHPDLPWSQCLSLGSAVSAICAISKGKAIGKISASESDGRDRKVDDNDHEEGIRTVLGFEIPVRKGSAYVGSTKKPANESFLKHKFGDRYDEVRTAMTDAIRTWQGHEEEFERKGFRMYEHFRPGGGGWGQQGGLDLREVKRAITRSP